MSERTHPQLAWLLVVLALAAALGPLWAHRAHAAPAKTAALTRARAARSVARTKSARPSPAAVRAGRLGLGTVRAAAQLLGGRPELSWVRAAGGAATLPGTLRFPVARGWFGRGFGSGEGGYHQAMDIGGAVGTSVRAAASGLVGYANDEINGYGNLVLIVHPGGWVTAYAHNRKLLVVAGQKVAAGAEIAELGSTGKSRGPHVHFELLFGGENCDPAPLFRPYVRLKTGKPVQLVRAVWKNPEKRPKLIACHARKHHPGRQKAEPEEPGEEESEELEEEPS